MTDTDETPRGDSSWMLWYRDTDPERTPRNIALTPEQSREIGLGSYGLGPLLFHLDDYIDEEEDQAALLDELPPLPSERTSEQPPLRPLRARDRWLAKQAQRKLDAGE
jgi:hypothetical protein